ncbi:putative signal transducing protein [Aquimarina sp. 2304DJ70-9]|uniref:putative signal transducing protein n=1 Tax=Aquimarina penaris TaxID=3231044 RepID=UPI0034623978
MFPESEYERVYTGSLINIQFLQTVLQDRGINSVTRDDMKSGMMAGFGGGIPDHIQLFVKKIDVEEAIPIIEKSLS